MENPDLLIRKQGRAGRITLNRPDALNALSYQMVLDIEKALLAWAEDGEVSLVIIDGAGERAFCAGGDIEEMYRTGRAGDFAYGQKFWRDEYRLNAFISRYPKPYVAVMHGFVMGGGVGVSAHGSHRIVTENSAIAMPECGIGLVPDVGGTHLLGRAPGHFGEFLGLTGYRQTAADAILSGFADIHVPTAKIPDLIGLLCDTGDLCFIETFSSDPEPGTLEPVRSDIDRIFATGTVAHMLDELEGVGEQWATIAAKTLRRNCPLSLECTVRLVRDARAKNDVVAALRGEYAFTSRSMEHGEFLEGIRAAIIDKDRNPQWRYPTLDAVPSHLIETMLAPVDGV